MDIGDRKSSHLINGTPTRGDVFENGGSQELLDGIRDISVRGQSQTICLIDQPVDLAVTDEQTAERPFLLASKHYSGVCYSSFEDDIKATQPFEVIIAGGSVRL